MYVCVCVYVCVCMCVYVCVYACVRVCMPFLLYGIHACEQYSSFASIHFKLGVATVLCLGTIKS